MTTSRSALSMSAPTICAASRECARRSQEAGSGATGEFADAWALASPSERPDLEFGARLALVISGGPSTSSLVILWGTTLVLYGLAVKMERYSIWLGWTGVVLGAAIFALGTIQFLEPNIFPGALFYGGGAFVSQIWTIVLGVAMWRRAGTNASYAGGDE